MYSLAGQVAVAPQRLQFALKIVEEIYGEAKVACSELTRVGLSYCRKLIPDAIFE